MIKQILTKAISNGWELGNSKVDFFDIIFCGKCQEDFISIHVERGGCIEYNDINSIIFRHDFAKAYWGIKWCCNDKCQYCKRFEEHIVCWQYHIQQLALSEDRIKYLEQFL